MPTRMLRDWTDSRKMDGISAEAERLFVRMLMKADDYGRFHADPRIVNSLCFPMGDRKMADTSRNFRELETRRLLMVYEVGGRPFCSIVNYGQRLKQSKAKFPQMIGKNEDWLASDADFPELPGTSGLISIPNPIPNTISKPIPNTKAPDGVGYGSEFLEFWKVYPKKVGKDAAWNAWKKRNGSLPELITILLAVASQAESDQWTKDGGQYIPNPATWINQGRWADEVAPAVAVVDGSKPPAEWSNARDAAANAVWDAKETGDDVRRAIQVARDKWGDCPKWRGLDAVTKGVDLAMNNQRARVTA